MFSVKKLYSDIDLELSMYPSFVSALFVRKDNAWIKIAGYNLGAILKETRNTLSCKGCSEEAFKEWTGLWFNPFEHLNEIGYKSKTIFKIINSYRRLRIIVSSFDRPFILVLTFLSRNTDYHRNVRRWARYLFNSLESFETDTIRRRLNTIKSRSYQLRQLHEILESLSDIDFKKNSWKLRRELMEIKYIGPKVVDAFLLFSKYDTIFTPSNIHLRRFATRLRLINDKELIVPSKKQCLGYDAYCPQCPLREKCITGFFNLMYGRLSGFIQTIAYVHDSLWCSKNKCHVCPFRDICLNRNMIVK